MRRIALLVLLLMPVNVLAQNLVPNPSFEDTVSCPDFGGQVWKATFWETVANSPDYFNSCNPYYDFSVPNNFVGFQYASTGQAYMGLWIYQEGQTYRELLGTNLISPLVVGQKYFVSFNACLSFNPNYSNHGACNNLGVLFSTFNYLNSNTNITGYCQIKSDSIIKDSLNWTIIKGSFFADSVYTFITFGNFFSNSNTDTLHLIPSNAYRAYYYLDDICISTDSLYCEQWTNFKNYDNKNKINISYNLSKDKIIINCIPQDCNTIEILDYTGKTISNFQVQSGKSLEIDSKKMKNGFYLIVCRKKTGDYIKKINIIK